MVSEDANFKMKGRDRSSRVKDPTLGPGWAYMVASNEYLNYLVKHIHEDEVHHILPVRCTTEFTILQIGHCVSFPLRHCGQQTTSAPRACGHRGLVP
jgi:hypothetical protein